jgi:formate dehydrogenase alpha subunit
MSGVLRLDGIEVACVPGETLLEAARRAGLGARIPTLCHLAGSLPEGGCRLCLVEVDGKPRPVAACHAMAEAGQVVSTSSQRLHELRRGLLQVWADARPAAAGEASVGGDKGNQFNDLLREYKVLPATDVRAAAVPDPNHPYLRFSAERCLVCRRCVQVCADLQGQFVYGIGQRGPATELLFGVDNNFDTSPCVSCGACVEVCPTGALFDIDRESPGTAADTSAVRSVCGYCGVGCNVDVRAAEGVVTQIGGTPHAAVNGGHLCAKGRYAHAWQNSPERLTTPLLRVDGTLQPVSWPEAMAWLAGRLTEIRTAHGPDALGAMSSSRSTNEAAYLLQKLFRSVIGTNNIDCCARVCHSSTALGLQLMTGTGAASASYADIERAHTIIVAGANPTEAHPVIGARIKQAARRGARLIVIDPRSIELCGWADVHLQLRPGTNVLLFNVLARVLIEADLIDQAYLAQRTEGLAALRDFLLASDLAEAVRETGVSLDLLRTAALAIGQAALASNGRCLFVTGLGLSELSQGTDSVMAFCNLALLTGSIGKSGGGMLPLRGQNNVQGNADMGGMPDCMTGYQRVDDESVQARVTALWGRPVPAKPGLTIPQMFDAVLAGSVRGLWIQGEDVAQSDPNEQHVHAALSALELLVVQELFLSETARYAHLVLPAAGVLEQDGTFTNGERRIQRVRAVVPPPGEARPDWEATQAVANALGAHWSYTSPGVIMDEIAKIAPALFGGVCYSRLEGDGLQWPCPDVGHPGTATVHADGFVRGRGRLMTLSYAPTPERRCIDYPLLLTTGRVLQHYNVGTMTRRTPHRELEDADYLEINPQDAAAADIDDGARVHITSRYGTAVVRSHITGRVPPGLLFLSFHFPESHTNALTSAWSDPDSRCPEYKLTAVRIAAADTPDARNAASV